MEFAVGGNFDAAVTSDPEIGDVVWLMDTASESAVLGIFIAPSGQFSPATMVQAMGQPEFLEQNLFVSPESDRLLLDQTDTTAAILVRDADTPEHLVYLEVIFPEGEDYYLWVGFDLWDPEAYEGVFADVRDGIEISGVDLFSVADTEELLELINEPVTDDSSPEAEPTGEVDATPEADATEAADNPGLIDEGEYESPQHGTGITWTETWIVDENREVPIGSNEEAGFDWIFLTDAETESTVVFLTVEEVQSSDPEDVLAQITAEGYNEDVFGIDPESEVLLSDTTEDSAAIMVVDDSGPEPLVIVMEVHALDDEGLVAFVDFRAYASDINEDVLTAVEQDLEIDGQPGFTVFTVEDILAELEGI